MNVNSENVPRNAKRLMHRDSWLVEGPARGIIRRKTRGRPSKRVNLFY